MRPRPSPVRLTIALALVAIVTGGAIIVTRLGATPEAIAAPEIGASVAPRKGGTVRRAWPRKRHARRPHGRLGKWLAKQVGSGGAPPSGMFVAAPSIRGERGETLVYAPAVTPGPLSLVRSFEIPEDDPSYERLLNFSWVYDSALAAMAFSAQGDRRSADELLSQLAALQRTDGSLEYVFDTYSGASVPLFRSGTNAAVGLATVQYRLSFGSKRWDEMANLTARWLLTQQERTPGHPAEGLLYGGPDASWMSTQHNIYAYFFLRRFYQATVDDLDGVIPIFECVQKDPDGTTWAVFGYDNRNPYQVVFPAFATNHLSPTTLDGPPPDVFEPGRHHAVFRVAFPPGNVVWHLGTLQDVAREKKGPACEAGLVVAPPAPGPPLTDFADAAEQIARGIERVLLVDDATGLHFIQGYDDRVLPADAQALGILFLLDRGDVAAAQRVADYLVGRLLTVGRSILLSGDPATYNMTYESTGPFLGFRPYADAAGPDVVWMEGTSESRFALAVLGGATQAIDDAVRTWRDVTWQDREGLLGADRALFDPDFNEYHVWPTSAATSWYLLSLADPGRSIFTTVP
jgi:hypothetical protein